MSTSRRVARNTAVQVVAEAFTKVASLVLYVVMARELGKQGFGDFSFAASLAILATVLAGFGIDDVLTRDASKDRQRAPRMLTDGIAVKVVIGTAGVFVALGIVLVGDYSSDVRIAVVLLSVSYVLDLITKSHKAVFQAHDDLRPFAETLLVQRFFTAGVGIAVILGGGDVVSVCVVWLTGSVLGLAYMVRRLLRAGHRYGGAVSWSGAKLLISGSWAIGVASIFGTILFRLDATLLSFYSGNEAVAIYSAGYRLLESTLFLAYAFTAALLPTLSRLTRESDPPLGQAYQLGLKTIAIVLIPLGVAMVAFAQPIIDILYGDEFEDALFATRLLGGTVMLYGFTFFSQVTLVSQHRQYLLPRIIGFVMVINVGLNLILIPEYSYDGAAAATTISEAINATLMTFFAIRATGPISARRVLIGPLTAAGAMGGAAFLLGDGVLGLLVAPLVFVAVLAAVEHFFHPADLKSVLSIITRRRPEAVL